MATLDIAQLSRATGLSAATLRYYEQEGLLQPNGRKGLRRTYAACAVDRLTLIGLGRSAGFSLKEIRVMLEASSRPRIDKQVLRDKAKAVDQQIRELVRIREGLLHAVNCKAPDLMSCPHFQRVLRHARKVRPAAPPAQSTKVKKAELSKRSRG